LRPILATAIFLLLFAGVPLLVYWNGHKDELTPLGRSCFLASIVALISIGWPLGAAYSVVAYAPPGHHWRRWWRVTADWTCFVAGFGLFALAHQWLLLPLVGEPIGTLIFFGVGGGCVLLLLKRAQHLKK
jgi:hypothetical protein